MGLSEHETGSLELVVYVCVCVCWVSVNQETQFCSHRADKLAWLACNVQQARRMVKWEAEGEREACVNGISNYLFFPLSSLSYLFIMQLLCTFHRQYIMRICQGNCQTSTWSHFFSFWPYKTISHVAKVAQLPQHMLANTRDSTHKRQHNGQFNGLCKFAFELLPESCF